MIFKEIDIKGLLYKISEKGDILKRRGAGFNKQFPDKDGYLRITVVGPDNKTRNEYTHRAVYRAFVGDIPDGMTVDHIDNDKSNNHYSNLQLLTPEENSEKGNSRKWEFISPDGELVLVYNLKKFCEENGLHKSHMSEVYHGKPSHNQHKGWKRK